MRPVSSLTGPISSPQSGPTARQRPGAHLSPLGAGSLLASPAALTIPFLSLDTISLSPLSLSPLSIETSFSLAGKETKRNLDIFTAFWVGLRL